ncbi:MAG: alanine--glyoxylate aminotransferase family protein [Thermoplasmata archaeon]|nr:alanine--glyoxylate aminotransferase family protein [Thermoplasmata archaeon]MCI4337691.1 alanine--glyoxylate aminotransferase family protein [Thermoplasmata archaeon]MCI4340835.1 alanine--glyoxylate aminotransferase family protein [Thermoplasmata archaeon]
MPYDPETATFLIAGPVRIHPRVLRAMSTPSLNHRGEYFHGIVAEIRELLPVLFGTQGAQVVLSGSGTSGLEAVYSSLLRRGERTITVSNGNFGERTDAICRRYCEQVTTVSAPWGQPLPVERIREELARGDVRALCVVYNETSVGLRNDLAAIAPDVRKAGALFLVDGISAVAGIPCPIGEWGIDALVAGSQKGLAAPAGLAMVHLSERAVGELRPATFYLDLAEHLKSLANNDTPWTPAVPLFLALLEALRLLQEEGLATRLERTRAMALASRAAVAALGLELFPDPAHASDTVTAVRNPPGLDDARLRKVLAERYQVLLQGGQGALKGKIFRIGHMGIANWADLLVTFAGLERILAHAGRLPSPGAGLGAISAGMPSAG